MNDINSSQDTSEAPDIFTATDEYASRFKGEAGEFFLKTQERSVLSSLPQVANTTILEVGGAHAQLTRSLLAAGAEVWVHASSDKSFERVKKIQEDYPEKLHLFSSSMFEIPFTDQTFDNVIAIRLISHVNEWEKLIHEMCRVAKHSVTIDYPPKSSFNILYPLFFALKRKMEGKSTRTFLRFSCKEMAECFSASGFNVTSEKKQFFFPMALHRVLKNAAFSEKIEKCCNCLGLTALFGAPIILTAVRKGSDV